MAPLAGLDALARLDAVDPYIAETVGDALASVNVHGIAELARAQAAMSFDREALRAATASMSAELARLSTTEIAAMAAEGARAGMEGAALAMSMAPFAADGGLWSTAGARSRGYRTSAPEPWDAQDPADSLYRDARKALTGESYQRAAELFKQIRQRYPKSSYAQDAPYWEAFALQRLGGQQNLYLALDALGLQQRDYPRAATRGDAAALNARIEGMLGRRGDAAAAQTLRGRAERAANDGCPRADEDERVDALNAVAQMDAERAMPVLKKVLARREPCTQQLRRTAVWLVARQKSSEAAALLVNTARTDPDRDVREQAVFWLASVSSTDAVNMLIDLARNGDDLDLRKRAVYALSRAKSEPALAALRDITTDSKAPEELRAEALGWYLGRSGASSAQPLSYLTDIFTKADGVPLKQVALRYIAGLRTDESRAWLVALALNDRESLDLRRTAVAMIPGSGGGAMYFAKAPSAASGQVSYAYTTTPASTGSGSSGSGSTASAANGAAVATALWQVYERSPELELRRQALGSLAALRDNAGVDRLIAVARTEKNPELRRAAITYLTRSKDPRALEVLQEIINK